MGSCINCGCDAVVPDRGIKINHFLWLGCQIVSLQTHMPMWEKQSRKTPPKYLVGEWEKVRFAKERFEKAKVELEALAKEFLALKAELGYTIQTCV